VQLAHRREHPRGNSGGTRAGRWVKLQNTRSPFRDPPGCGGPDDTATKDDDVPERIHGTDCGLHENSTPFAGMTRSRFDGRRMHSPSQPAPGLPWECHPKPPVASSSTAGGWQTRRVLRTALLHSLAGARLYLCTDSRRREGDLENFLEEVLGAGVDVVQLREKGLEAAEELELLAVVAAAARRHGRLVAVNDRADLAALTDSDVFHAGQQDLTPSAARSLLGPDVIIGRSTHSPNQFDAAVADPDVDYACVGPVWATPTKPGRPAAGLETIRHAASSTTEVPWFAIGGIALNTIQAVVEAGAQRVVVVRAITQSDDPAGATTALLQNLPPLAGRTAGSDAAAMSSSSVARASKGRLVS